MMPGGMNIRIYNPIKPFETKEKLSVAVATQNRESSVLFRELRGLLDTLGYSVVKIFYQNQSKRNPQLFMGRGKLLEIKDFIHNNPVDLVIIDHNLRPIQIYKTKEILELDVFDRVRIILEIFVRTARSEEAKLQVELATLSYEIPLVREWIHQSKTGEHPGFRTGGEFQVSQYLNNINSRSVKIRDKLDKMKKTRHFRRERKRKLGSYSVSLAGYTNAGKTSLLNALSNEEIEVKDKFFTTLSTTTRRVSDSGTPILLTDTIGFIQYLPPFMIKAFRSTLEEIFFSDVIVLVVDISDDISEIARKMLTSYAILFREDNNPPVITAFNKADIVEGENVQERISLVLEELGEAGVLADSRVVISAAEGTGLDELVGMIKEQLPEYDEYIINVGNIAFNRAVENYIFDNFEIIEINAVDNEGTEGMSYRVFAGRIDVRRLEKEYPGVVEVVREDRGNEGLELENY